MAAPCADQHTLSSVGADSMASRQRRSTVPAWPNGKHQQARGDGRPQQDAGRIRAGDDTDVAATAANRPEEIRILTFVHFHIAAIRSDHVCRSEAVDRHAVLASQLAEPTSQCQSGDARCGVDPHWRGEPMSLGRAVDLSECRTRLHISSTSIRVDDDLSHSGHV